MNLDLNADGGFTLSVNTLTECKWDGGNASAITLPSATVDTLCVFRFTAAGHGGDDIVFTTALGDTYEPFSIQPPIKVHSDLGGNRGARCLPMPIMTTTTNLVVAAGDQNTFTVKSTNNNNQTNVGAELVWYCRTAGKWVLAFVPSFLGTGVINTTFGFTKVG